MSIQASQMHARDSLESLPIGEAIVLVAYIYIPRLIYKQVALMEPSQESDLQILTPEFREEVTKDSRQHGVIFKLNTEEPRYPRTVTLRRKVRIADTTMAADQLTYFMDEKEKQMQLLMRGNLTNSAALAIEFFPLNFRPLGFRGERPITREMERESWEDIRLGRSIPGSPRVSPVRELTPLNRTIWDPQPFLILVPKDQYFDFLGNAVAVLQLDAVSVQSKANLLSFTYLPMGELNHKGAHLEILCSLSLNDLGYIPTLDNLVEAEEVPPQRPLPGPFALQTIREILQDAAVRGEEAPWWVPRMPPPPRS